MRKTSNTVASANRHPDSTPIQLDEVPAARRRELAGVPTLRLAVDRPPHDDDVDEDEKPDYARLAREALSDRRSIEEQVLDRVTDSLMHDVARVNRMAQPRMPRPAPISGPAFPASPKTESHLRIAPSWKRGGDAAR